MNPNDPNKKPADLPYRNPGDRHTPGGQPSNDKDAGRAAAKDRGRQEPNRGSGEHELAQRDPND